MARVSKVLADKKFRYISVLDIKDAREHRVLFHKIKKLVEES